MGFSGGISFYDILMAIIFDGAVGTAAGIAAIVMCLCILLLFLLMLFCLIKSVKVG